MTSQLPPIELTRIVAAALAEDLGRGDITTDACVPPNVQGRCAFRARTELVLTAGAIIGEVFRQVDPAVQVHDLALDGTRLSAGAVIARVTGPAASLLKGERVALNFLQRLCGVATLTRRYVDALPAGSRTRIVDTRKTTPGLRALERRAVRAGGGHNHREDLSSAVLIKDNHVAAAGGITAAITRCREQAPHTSRIECEVDSLEQLDEALAAHADIVLLDNFDDAQVQRAIAVNAASDWRALLEASGGITLARVTKLAQLGVDVISVGALTHSAPAVDIGLDWEP
ncbi:MAG: Quinolinate phosphoribosyltransferase [Myxococcaceae bacterium]|nr:Quinolinate phosphoribosyltransferase [Myxococcaceae bacterium]